jgi:hypothetical protein
MMRKIVLIFFLSLLTACATQRVRMVNDRGDELTCERTGYGFFGALATANYHNECVSQAEQRGYHVKQSQ